MSCIGSFRFSIWRYSEEAFALLYYIDIDIWIQVTIDITSQVLYHFWIVDLILLDPMILMPLLIYYQVHLISHKFLILFAHSFFVSSFVVSLSSLYLMSSSNSFTFLHSPFPSFFSSSFLIANRNLRMGF